MKKTIKVGFQGQSKAVVAEAKIEYELDSDEAQTVSNESITEEAKKLYNEVDAHADLLTRQKRK